MIMSGFVWSLKEVVNGGQWVGQLGTEPLFSRGGKVCLKRVHLSPNRLPASDEFGVKKEGAANPAAPSGLSIFL